MNADWLSQCIQAHFGSSAFDKTDVDCILKSKDWKDWNEELKREKEPLYLIVTKGDKVRAQFKLFRLA